MRIIVYHGVYHCDSGCLGHWVDLIDGEHENGEPKVVRDRFDFGGPDENESNLAYAKRVVREQFGEEHIADLDWDNCVIERDRY